MKSPALLLVGLLCGGLLGWLAGRRIPSGSVEAERETLASSASMNLQNGSLETELARLRQENAELREQLSLAAEHKPATGGAETKADEQLAEANSTAGEASQADALAARSTTELLSDVQALRKTDSEQARTLVDALLARNLEGPERAQALNQLGFLERRAGDLLAAERAFHEAAIAGAHTDHGAWATYELALTLSERGDHAAASTVLELMDPVPNMSRWCDVHLRWANATIALRGGDEDAARAQFEAIVSAYDGDSEYQWMADQVRRQLDELE